MGQGTPGGSPLSGASGMGTMTPQTYGSSPMMRSGLPYQGGVPSTGLLQQAAGTPVTSPGNPFSAQQNAYFNYMAQALPSINNGIRAGTLQPGTAYNSLLGPQAFGWDAANASGPGNTPGGRGLGAAGGLK